jgi:hypothetical protein
MYIRHSGDGKRSGQVGTKILSWRKTWPKTMTASIFTGAGLINVKYC